MTNFRAAHRCVGHNKEGGSRDGRIKQLPHLLNIKQRPVLCICIYLFRFQLWSLTVRRLVFAPSCLCVHSASTCHPTPCGACNRVCSGQCEQHVWFYGLDRSQPLTSPHQAHCGSEARGPSDGQSQRGSEVIEGERRQRRGEGRGKRRGTRERLSQSEHAMASVCGSASLMCHGWTDADLSERWDMHM